jgi:hypothetical protein
VAGMAVVNRKGACLREFPCRTVFAAYMIERFEASGGVMSRSPHSLARRIRSAISLVAEGLRALVTPPVRLIPIPVRVRPPRDPR